MTDFHAHLLPGVDDGSDSVETSLAMLREWQAQSVDCVCATPHFYADRTTPGRFLAQREQASAALAQAMRQAGCQIKVLLGAEIHFFSGMSAAQELDSLCLEGTRLLLLEMPFVRWSEHMIDEVERVIARGIVPVMAHLERYWTQQSRRLFKRLLSLDLLVQLNAQAFLDRCTRRRALRMLDAGEVHFLGSDAHNMTTRRPNFAAAWDCIGDQLGDEAQAHLERHASMITFGRT